MARLEPLPGVLALHTPAGGQWCSTPPPDTWCGRAIYPYLGWMGLGPKGWQELKLYAAFNHGAVMDQVD